VSSLNVLKSKAVTQRAGKIFCIVFVNNGTILVYKAAIDIMFLQQRISGIETNAEHTALFGAL
jgi:sRNA-binding regulator protein Hfq